MTFRGRLLRGASVATIWRTGAAAPAPARSQHTVHIGEVVDLGDGNEAVGLDDGDGRIRIEIRRREQ